MGRHVRGRRARRMGYRMTRDRRYGMGEEKRPVYRYL